MTERESTGEQLQRQIVAELDHFQIPYAEWQEPYTLDRLMKEVSKGESRLERISLESLPGREVLVRDVEAVSVILYHHVDGELMELRPYTTRLPDGQEVPLKRPLSGTIGEKLIPGENPLAAGRRACLQELGVIADLQPFQYMDAVRLPLEYPGLPTRDRLHVLYCVLDPSWYREEYVEQEEGYQTLYRWMTVVEANQQAEPVYFSLREYLESLPDA